MSKFSKRHKTETGRAPRSEPLITGGVGPHGADCGGEPGARPGKLAGSFGLGAIVASGYLRGLPRSALRIRSRDDGVTIQCRCGHFSLSFHSIAVARHGRFRCLICGLEEAISDLIDVDGRPRGIATRSAGRDALR